MLFEQHRAICLSAHARANIIADSWYNAPATDLEFINEIEEDWDYNSDDDEEDEEDPDEGEGEGEGEEGEEDEDDDDDDDDGSKTVRGKDD